MELTTQEYADLVKMAELYKQAQEAVLAKLPSPSEDEIAFARAEQEETRELNAILLAWSRGELYPKEKAPLVSEILEGREDFFED
jgi:hypothetical protein